MSKANNVRPSRPPQFTPVVPPQKPPQFMQPVAQQFRPAGQTRLGANSAISRQMPHFPQSGKHFPRCGQVQPASQAAPMAYQPARPKSSEPLQSQQQSVFSGGYLPTRGAPIPPPSYTRQSSSVPPPVGQSRGTTQDQSLPLVVSMMQPGYQPGSAPPTLASVNSAEPRSSDWREHTSTDGKSTTIITRRGNQVGGNLMTPLEVTQFANAKVKSAESSSSDWQEKTSSGGKKYYYNKKTRQSSWGKPVELMVPLEGADSSTEWIGFCTSEGRKYYYNRVTNESKWTIPDELKIAQELAEKALNQPPDRETETIAGAPVGPSSVCEELSSVTANQSSSIVANFLHPNAGLSHNLDNNFSNVGIQHGGPNTTVAPVITSTEIPLVENDSGTSRNNNENSYLTSSTDTQDGASAEDLQVYLAFSHVSPLAEKTMPVAAKVHATPLEVETSEGLVIYANKLDAKNAFITLLESVESDWTWEQAMRVIINDERYGALGTLKESLQAFNEYFNKREKLELEERCVKHRNTRDNFITMLKECNKLTPSTRLSEAITMFEDDERFNAVELSREREDLVEAYLAELQKKEEAKAAEKHQRHIAEYRAFLESCDFIKASTRWRKVQDRLEDDERCSRLEIVDRLDIFKEYIQDLEKEEEEQKRLQQEEARRQERRKRDDFRKMLEEHVADGTLTAKTRWGLYCEQVKDSNAYLEVASNTTGSTPKDLFEDVMEDLEEQYQADKAKIKEAIESRKIPLMTSWTLEGFRTAVMENGTFKGISGINIKLIYVKQIKRLMEKELNEAKKRQRLSESFSDLLYSIVELSASSAWDDSKPLFEDSQEYRALESESYARDLFEKHVLHLKERSKDRERLREEEKAKKEREREERERKREREEKERNKEKEKKKEKERKENEHKEKERAREKERERDKGKDWSRRENMDLDGANAVTHGSKDKETDKDKENKHRRRHRDTTDDVISERDDSKQSERHSSDRKKPRKHTIPQTSIVKTCTKDLQGSRLSPQNLCT